MKLKAIVLFGIYVVLTGYLTMGVYADSYKRKYNPLVKDGFCYIPDNTKAINISSSVVFRGNGSIVWANGQVSTAPVTASGATWGVIGGEIGDQSDLSAKFNSVGESTTTLKSVSDAHAATLLQVGIDTATLAGMVGSGYFTVSPSTGIDAGTLADGVKVTTGNVTASGTPDGTTFLRGDGAWATPSGIGDMVQSTHGVAIGASTATLRTDVTALQQSTGTLQADLATEVSDRGLADAAIGVTTGTLRTDVTAVQSTLTTVGDSTATLRTDLTALAVSTGMFTTVATATGTLRTDVNALKASTGVVSYTSQFITYGSTQTFVTYVATQVVCGLQTSGFTISSATARVNGGTSATVRLFITAKNSEYDVSAATPIWSSAVTAGTAHTGGTMSNTAVAADQCITAVIDGISGAVVDIVLWVRGTR